MLLLKNAMSMDYLIVASNSYQETLHGLNNLFQVLQEHNITFFAAKCTFHQTHIKYLGFEITQNQIYPIKSNIIKITSFPTPKNKKQLKQFSSTTDFYRHLILAYAELTLLLVELTSPKIPFKWTQLHKIY